MKFEFRKSTRQNKKYDAVFADIPQNGKLRGRVVSFGDTRYQQFHDATPLRIYSHLDHNDPERRRLYLARHAKDLRVPYSAGWFAARYLW